MNTRMGTLERYFAAAGLAEEGLRDVALVFLQQTNFSPSPAEKNQDTHQTDATLKINMPEVTSRDETDHIER